MVASSPHVHLPWNKKLWRSHKYIMEHNVVELTAKELLKILHLVGLWLTVWECPCRCGWRWGRRGRWGWRSTRHRSSWCRPSRGGPRSPAHQMRFGQFECKKTRCSCWQWFRCHIIITFCKAIWLASYDSTIGTRTTIKNLQRPGQRGQRGQAWMWGWSRSQTQSKRPELQLHELWL